MKQKTGFGNQKVLTQPELMYDYLSLTKELHSPFIQTKITSMRTPYQGDNSVLLSHLNQNVV